MDRTHPDSGQIIKDGGPAFPVPGLVLPSGDSIWPERGMTLRDWFAGQALMGLLASRNPTTPRFHPDDDAQYVYAVADAMLAAREVKP